MIELLLLLALASHPDRFGEAKVMADADEADLSASDMASLVRTQGEVAQLAFAECVQHLSERGPPNFGIVLQVDEYGRVVEYWSDNDDKFSGCVGRVFSERFKFLPPKAPFYSSFIYRSK